MRQKLLYLTCLATLWAGICAAQSANKNSQITFTNWGESVRLVRLAVVLTNDIVSVGSDFSIFIRMENSSTNTIYAGESSRGGDYMVSLKDDSGRIYTLTRNSLINTYNMLLPMNPGESRYWVKLVGVNKYFDPPGIRATKSNVPPGGYTLEVTRTFITDKANNKPELLKANLLKVEVK